MTYSDGLRSPSDLKRTVTQVSVTAVAVGIGTGVAMVTGRYLLGGLGLSAMAYLTYMWGSSVAAMLRAEFEAEYDHFMLTKDLDDPASASTGPVGFSADDDDDQFDGFPPHIDDAAAADYLIDSGSGQDHLPDPT